MEETHKIVIALVLSLGCIGVFAFEIIKRMEVSVTWEKLAAAVVALVYCIVFFVMGQLQAFPAILFVLGSAGLVWFGDELGSMTGMSIRGGTINKASPGFLVRIFGWLFLLFPLGLAVYSHFVSQGQ